MIKKKARPQTRTTALQDQNVIQFHIYRNKSKFQVHEKQNLKNSCRFIQGYIESMVTALIQAFILLKSIAKNLSLLNKNYLK